MRGAAGNVDGGPCMDGIPYLELLNYCAAAVAAAAAVAVAAAAVGAGVEAGGGAGAAERWSSAGGSLQMRSLQPHIAAAVGGGSHGWARVCLYECVCECT